MTASLKISQLPCSLFGKEPFQRFLHRSLNHWALNTWNQWLVTVHLSWLIPWVTAWTSPKTLWLDQWGAWPPVMDYIIVANADKTVIRLWPGARQADRLLPVKQLKLSVFNKRADSISACLKFFLFVPFSKLHKQTHKMLLMVPSWHGPFFCLGWVCSLAQWGFSPHSLWSYTHWH